jgi:hypothetical protein
VGIEAGTFWAVLANKSDFSVVPEPGNGALLTLGLGDFAFQGPL